MGIDSSDNELITLELVHHFVEVLDRYFGNVCELDLIFNFHKVCLLRSLRSPSQMYSLCILQTWMNSGFTLTGMCKCCT